MFEQGLGKGLGNSSGKGFRDTGHFCVFYGCMNFHRSSLDSRNFCTFFCVIFAHIS